MNERIIKVLIVDDHPSFAQGLRALIAAIADDMDVVGVATTVEAGLKEVASQSPDVMIMDLRMPDVVELDFIQRVRDEHPDVKLLVLTGSGEAGLAREVMALGVHGFLFKDVEVEDLVGSIRVIDAGKTVLAPAAIENLLSAPAYDALAITAWEVEALKLVAEGLDNHEIADRLSVSESTLKRNLRVIQDKLGARNRVDAAVLAAKLGLI